MKRFITLVCLTLSACNLIDPESPEPVGTPETSDPRLESIARMFASLPIKTEHIQEVYDAVSASSGNGYDEEYTMDCLISAPGAGVGDKRTKAAVSYGNPLRNLIRAYLEEHPSTKGGVEDLMDDLAASGYQLYWPYSEDWDGKSYPIITFDPGYGAESNYGFAISYGKDGTMVVDSVYVDEKVALKRPVWVINNNRDSAFSPVDFFSTPSPSTAAPQARTRTLLMKSFRMLRNYDSWFAGASEFWIKIGSVNGFSASTEAELKLYSPGVTEFMLIVKRKQVGKELPLDVILMTDFTSQLEKVAFLVTEDDGGIRTNWKCQAAVKIQSKSYGFDIDIPYHDRDDIVWRGQLSRSFFEQEDIVSGRFGDVIIKFELD